MKAALKLLLPLLFFSTALSSLLFTTGCKDDLLTSGDTTTVANPNVKVYRNITIDEFLTASSFSSINLNDGVLVTANDAIRDAELSDSSAFGPDRFYIRSGDGTVDPTDNFAIGQETKFAPFYDTRSSSYPQSSFDAITHIDTGSSGPLASLDFTTHNTNSLGTSFVSSDIRVYGFWLKGKKINYGLSYEVFGIMYLKSIFVDGSGYHLTVDVKVNQKGQNDFRERIPATTSTY